jgi:signal transduction histidine kinase/ActR/RegA family two-component response regulator
MSETGIASQLEGQKEQPALERARRAPRRRGLTSRLAWAFGSVAVILLLILGVVLTLVSYTAQLEQINIRQQKTADGAAVLTSEYLTRAQTALAIHGSTASGSALMLRPFETQQAELGSILSGSDDMFQTVTLLDDQGSELAKVSRYEDYGVEDLGNQADSPAFAAALEGQVYVDTQTRQVPYAEFPAILMAVPIAPRPGSDRPGVLLADVSIEGMRDALAQVEVGETGYAYLVDRETGELLAHSEPGSTAALADRPLDQVSSVDRVMDEEPVLDYPYSGLEGTMVIGAASQLPDTNWTLIVELPTEEALADVRQMLYLLVGLLVVGAVVAGGLGLLLPRRIVRPLLTVQEGAQQIGAGHLDHVIHVETGDEIQDLAESFNEMAASLAGSQAELEQWARELEGRVEERTSELAGVSAQMRQRATRLAASAEIARAISSVRDLDLLLLQVTQLISERFGWYHVGIFMVDEARRYAVLRAANSPGGQRMLARGHSLRIGEKGIVGYVTHSGESRIALDVGEDAVYFDNPDLPETRSEMALPLEVEGQIIGALDVQSKEAAAYDDEDVAMLRILTGQVAIAIANSRLFEQSQRALEEVQSLHQQYVEQEWARAAVGRQELAYEYRRSGTEAEWEPWPSELDEAFIRGEPVVHYESPQPVGDRDLDAGAGAGSDGNGTQYEASLAAPIKYRDQVIGLLDLQETDEPRQWTDDEVALVQAISDQVGLALENARLFADTQRRAEQMATVNRIGLSITSDLDMKGVLGALYEQINRMLAIDSFYVALYDAETGMIEFPLLIGLDGPVESPPRPIEEVPGITGYVIESRESLHLRDLRSLPEDVPFEIVVVDDDPTHSYIGVPLMSRDQVIGVLSVQSSTPNAYSEEDLRLLETVATQASAAIENARAYERLAETAEELREIDRFKTQFLANMSHELRTPLNSIIGFSRVMLKGIDGPLTDLQAADLQSIHNSGQHLLSLINSILDMSKIEAGKMELAIEELALPPVLDAVLDTTKALIKDQPVELRTNLPDDLPMVWADAQRVRQVLLNLMSNAAKFTDGGQITLSAETGSKFVTISVADTGIGIDPEAQDRLFIPFQQVDGSTTRRAGGTGLGLAISRSFVEMHGGEIWVDSEPGQGATFSFTLPIFRDVQQETEDAEEPRLDPGQKLVLAIDDDAGVITLLKRYLENDGYQVIGESDPLRAEETAERLAPQLSAITLDVVMPHTNGWQILRDLKENPKTRDIPVVLCSIVEGLEPGLERGAAAYLRKPVTREELLSTLQSVARRIA